MMTPDSTPQDVEISPRFRQSIERRIERLEEGARFDESQLEHLVDREHIRRQCRLIAAQRAEILRMRLFLDRTSIRLPRPAIAVDQNLSN
jgi:ribosome-associated translation inhibitor RaiA